MSPSDKFGDDKHAHVHISNDQVDDKNPHLDAQNALDRTHPFDPDLPREQPLYQSENVDPYDDTYARDETNEELNSWEELTNPEADAALVEFEPYDTDSIDISSAIPVTDPSLYDLNAPNQTPIAVATEDLDINDLALPTNYAGADISATGVLKIDDAADPSIEAFYYEKCDVIKDTLANKPPAAEEFRLLCELAEIYEEQLGEREEAIVALKRARELSPPDENIVRSLMRLYQHTWQQEEEIDLLLDYQDMVEDPNLKVEFLARVAELYRDSGENDKFSVVLEAAESINANHPSLKALHAGQSTVGPIPGPNEVIPRKAIDPIVELEKSLATISNDEQKIALLKQISGLYLERGMPQRAAEYLRDVLHIDRRDEYAFTTLEELYFKGQNYNELIQIFELHIRVVETEKRVELLKKLADIYHYQLSDSYSMIATYERILELSPSDKLTFETLNQYYQSNNDVDAQLSLLRRAADYAQDKDKVYLVYQQAELLRNAFDDHWGAEELYQRALELDPGHIESINILFSLYSHRGDWAKALRLLLKAEKAVSSPAHRAYYLFEAAQAKRQHLDDAKGSVELYFKTLEADPDHQYAAEALAEILTDPADYQRLLPILELLLRKIGNEDPQKKVDINNKLAVVAASIDDDNRAEKHFRQALSIDESQTESLLGLGDLAFRRQDYSLALNCYDRLLMQDLEHAQRALALKRVGDAHLQLGNNEQAKAAYHDILVNDPQNSDVLAALDQAQSNLGDWRGVIRSKEQLTHNAQGEQAYQLWLEIGDIYREHLHDPNQAESAYRQSLNYKENDRVVLHRLLDLCSENQRWSETVKICQKIAESESEAHIKAKYFGAAATILEHNLKDDIEAVRFYNLVLDVHPQELKAFSAIDSICTRNKDWALLERNYGKMLKRLGDSADKKLRTMLWHNLGEILRSRRHDYEQAVAAFEAAQNLQGKDSPESREREKILGELYLRLGEPYQKKAIQKYEGLVRRDNKDYRVHHSLWRLYIQQAAYDKAFCMSCALHFLRKGAPETEEYYTRYTRKSIPRATMPLTPEHWQRVLIHPDQDLRVSTIFSVLAPIIIKLTAKSHSSYSLKPKEKIDIDSQPNHPFYRLLKYVSGMLGSPRFDLYFCQDKHMSLQVAHTLDCPSLLIGSEILKKNRTEKELSFKLAKAMSQLRPDVYLRMLLPNQAQLQGVLLAAARIFQPKIPLPPAEEKSITKLSSRIRKLLDPNQMNHLFRLFERFAHVEKFNLGSWWNAIDITTDRAAFILTNDLVVSANEIQQEGLRSPLSPKERLRQLLLFSLSNDYFSLREELQITIEDMFR